MVRIGMEWTKIRVYGAPDLAVRGPCISGLEASDLLR